MLTAALRVYHWDRRTSSIFSDRLDDADLGHLARAIAEYRRRLGQSRSEVRNGARAVLEGLRPDRIEPVVKLLDDTATYEWPQGSRQADRRVAIFEAAARSHPLADLGDAEALLARMLDPPPRRHEEAVARLYADYPEFHRLREFPTDYTEVQLRADYDLGQAQALLFSATQVTVEARQDYKHILRYARLARLLWFLREWGDGYRLELSGPSSILRHTHQYGVELARFLGGLVHTGDWRLRAEIALRKGWKPFTFALSADDGLGAGHPAPPAFDSRIEEALATQFGDRREGWTLVREGRILRTGGSLLVPDFVFRHDDGTEVVLEIVGYWTPEYLAEKWKRLAGLPPIHLIVAVPKRLAARAGELPAAVLPFATRIPVRDLLARLESFRPAPNPA